MPIADSTLILEGQQDFSGGMNSSLAPTLIPENAVATAVNLTFRGGRPRSRPGFRQVGLQGGTPTGLDILTSELNQGVHFYSERRERYNAVILGVFGGNVIKINLSDYSVDIIYPILPVTSPKVVSGLTYTINFVGTTDFTLLGASSNTVGLTFTKNATGATGTGQVTSTAKVFDASLKCYFVQAENFLIIQNGVNTPVIWDGDNLFYSGSLDAPAGTAGAVAELHSTGLGTIMAYGQGRLFVVDTARTQITAGDLAFGGSTSQFEITSGTNTANRYRVTTASANGFVLNDIVTISGHSSSSGVNGTWEIAVIHSSTEFDIDLTDSSAKGTGGFVTKANVGSVSDLLRFSETTYLSEGGSLQIPASMGKITGMIFLPVQDTGTGQGDLIVFCERGTASFAVSTPRDQWKSTVGFQRVLFLDIGATSHTSLVTANGDIFFRSFDGLRTYRNARAELSSFGQVPLSAEMNSVLNYDTKAMLGEVSSIVFDNRLLFLAGPKIDNVGKPSGSTIRSPTTFSKIVALDFTTLSGVGGKRAAAYDGIWAGLDCVQLVSGIFENRPRAWAFSLDYANSRINVLWEITENAEFDLPQGAEPQKINSILETKAFSFGSPSEQKRIIRADFWLSDIEAQVDATVYWRPDQYPCWKLWHSFSRCATLQTCVESGVFISCDGSNTTLQFTSASTNDSFYRLVKDGKATNPIQYSNSANAAAQALVVQNELIAIGFPVTVVRTGTFPDFLFTITSSPAGCLDSNSSPLTYLPVKSSGAQDCLSNFTIRNLQPQYRPQIRMPTPPEDTDPIISRPFIYGNDFQLRIEFSGHFQLIRILLLGQRILEQYQGTDTLEVL